MKKNNKRLKAATEEPAKSEAIVAQKNKKVSIIIQAIHRGLS